MPNIFSGEISGLDIPIYNPVERQDYVDLRETLFVVSNKKKDMEYGVSLDKIVGAAGGGAALFSDVYPPLTSGMSQEYLYGHTEKKDLTGLVYRDQYTGNCLNFKSILGGREDGKGKKLYIECHGDRVSPTGLILKIKANLLGGAKNLQESSLYFPTKWSDDHTYLGSTYSGELPAGSMIVNGQPNPGSMMIRGVTGAGGVLVSGLKGQKMTHWSPNEISSKVSDRGAGDPLQAAWVVAEGEYNKGDGDPACLLNKYTSTRSGIAEAYIPNQIYSRGYVGSISEEEKMFSISDQGSAIGYLSCNNNSPRQLDFSRDRVIFLNTAPGLGQYSQKTSLDFIPVNLQKGTVLTLIVTPRAPYVSMIGFRAQGKVGVDRAIVNLDESIFSVVGDNPFPHENQPFNKGGSATEAIRIHMLCQSVLPPKILVSFNGIESDLKWNTNLHFTDRLGGDKDAVDQSNYSFASNTDFTMTKLTNKNVKSYPRKYGAFYPSVGIMGYGLAMNATNTNSLPLAGDISQPEMEAEGMALEELPSAGENFINSLKMGFNGEAFSTPLAHSTKKGMSKKFGGTSEEMFPYSACGNNNTFMIGNIATENEDLESYMFFTGSDYRYDNTGLNLP